MSKYSIISFADAIALTEKFIEKKKHESEVLWGNFSTAKFAKTRALPKPFTEKGLVKKFDQFSKLKEIG